MLMYHPQYEEFYDRLTKINFEKKTIDVEGQKLTVAVADIGELDPLSFIDRGFKLVEPKPEPKPKPKKE